MKYSRVFIESIGYELPPVVVTSTDEDAGEVAMGIRAQLPTGLGWLGAALDAQANDRHATVIDLAQSRIALRVIPTDEELMIARYTHELLRGEAATPRH